MKIKILPIALVLMLFCSCQNDDEYTESDFLEGSATYTLPTISLNTASLTETETLPSSTSDEYGDYIESATFSDTISVVFNSTTAEVSDDLGYTTVSGNHVTVNSSASKFIVISVSGTTTDGSLKIYSDKKFALVLNGVNITNPTGAAINNQCGKTMYVVVADGTTNTLTDGTTYTTTSGEDMKATLFSEGQMAFSGTGTLTINANCKNGICSDDYIRIRPNTNIAIYSTASNGIKANEDIIINGGVLNIQVTADGAKGIKTDSCVTIAGGRTTIINTGSTSVEGTDTTKCSAIKCDKAFEMTGGELYIESSGEGGKGISTDGDVTFSDGTAVIVAKGTKELAAPKGIKSDGSIVVSAGSFQVYSVYSKACDDADEEITVEGTPTTNEQSTNVVRIIY